MSYLISLKIHSCSPLLRNSLSNYIRNIIATFWRVRYWALTYANSVELAPLCSLSLISTLTVSTTGQIDISLRILSCIMEVLISNLGRHLDNSVCILYRNHGKSFGFHLKRRYIYEFRSPVALIVTTLIDSQHSQNRYPVKYVHDCRRTRNQ
jgi:hypothetical protein